MNSLPRVTIGIPAYNEVHNISHLLQALLNQETTDIVLEKIIVVSDGSSDGTEKAVKKVRDSRIQLITLPKRYGVNWCQNEIAKMTRSEILLYLNADVLPEGRKFLEEICAPIISNPSIGCVGANTVSLPPRTWVERILSNSHYFKQHIYRQINYGDTGYLCHGRARAFSKSFYMKLRWPDNCPEDAYSYLLCKKMGFNFFFASQAKVFFRSPSSILGHIKQSNRFLHGFRQLDKIFEREFVRMHFHIPKRLLIQSFIRYLLRNPISTPGYIVLMFYIRLFKNRRPFHFSRYSIAQSSKKIV